MPNKNASIKLEYVRTPGNFSPKGQEFHEEWRVVQVTDSILFHPGQLLTKTDVRELCDNGAWKVTVVGRQS